MLPRVDLIRADSSSWLLLNNSDHISDFIRKNGYWGLAESSIAKVFIQDQEDVNVVDVGANIGGFTVPTAQLISNKKGIVHAFEPQRIVFQQLCANVFLNQLDNVHVYNVALGNSINQIQIPELDFWESKNVGGLSVDQAIRKNINEDALSGKTFQNTETGIVYSVEQKTLDCFQFNFNINLIKVDVEGYELEFFQGSVQTVKASGFPPIIFELWQEKTWYESKAEKTKNILSKWGYKFNYFGREILAQHPAHKRQCQITKNGNNFDLTIIKND